MGKTQAETALAVASGYWPLYRFNPQLAAEGKNPFVLDAKEPDGSLREFLRGEVRYAALEKTFPEEAARLHGQLEKEFALRYLRLKQKAEAAPVEVAAGPAPQGESGDDTDACTLAGTAEHDRADSGEACDDGRAG